VLLKDQHEGYITWEEFERNQRVIADNATGKGSAIARGAARQGELILAGLLRCGHCGRKMYVGYGKSGRYYCRGAFASHGTELCISFGGLKVDQAIAAKVLRVLKPLGIDAAVKALEAQTTEMSAARRQLDLALAQANYEAAHARRQYDSVDPANRLVAGELERRWNEALQAVHRVESEIAALDVKRPLPLSEKERQHLMQLGADLERAWSHPAASAATRKRVLRAALHEIIARIENGFIEMVLHWQGGDHTALKLKMNTVGKHRWTVPEDTLTLIGHLARQMPDKQIARHTAQQQPLEVIVQYPHHPHAGERLTVVRPLLYAGDAHYVVELPAGGRLLVPAWMTETSAATPPMVAMPRLSFACLSELRLLIDQQCVSSSPSLETIRNDGGADGTAYPRATTRSSHADGRRPCAPAVRRGEPCGDCESAQSSAKRSPRRGQNAGGGR
jgi:hypothetical protein